MIVSLPATAFGWTGDRSMLGSPGSSLTTGRYPRPAANAVWKHSDECMRIANQLLKPVNRPNGSLLRQWLPELRDAPEGLLHHLGLPGQKHATMNTTILNLW